MSESFASIGMSDSQVSPHQRAADAFARRVRDQAEDRVSSILLYGSVARGGERGPDSDVDILVVLRDTVDEAEAEDEIRDIAYDVELERGFILSLVVKTESEFERRKNRPFLRNVRQDAEVLHG